MPGYTGRESKFLMKIEPEMVVDESVSHLARSDKRGSAPVAGNLQEGRKRYIVAGD